MFTFNNFQEVFTFNNFQEIRKIGKVLWDACLSLGLLPRGHLVQERVSGGQVLGPQVRRSGKLSRMRDSDPGH